MIGSKILKITLYALLFALLIYLARFTYYICINKNSEINPPDKLQSIPSEAVWVGGIDGGAWYLCKKISSYKADCIIYNDNTGEVWESGIFSTKNGSLEEIDFLNSKSYREFNGDRLLLSNGAILKKE